MKCSAPPGRSTRRISARAVPTSGIVHRVQVREHMVDALIVEGKRLGVQADYSIGTGLGGDSFRGQLAPGGGRIDGPDVGQAGRVIGHVAARAEADLEHVAAQPAGDAGAQTAEFGTGHDEVDAPGKDLAFVNAHVRQCGTRPRSSRRRTIKREMSASGR